MTLRSRHSRTLILSPHLYRNPNRSRLIKALALAALGTTLSLTLFSCAGSQGFHRDELRTELWTTQGVDVNGKSITTSNSTNAGKDKPNLESTDAEITQALARKPQLPKPFRIGVYFEEPKAKGELLWRWSNGDKQKLLGAARKLEDAHEVSQVFELSPSLTRQSDLHSLRLAAAKCGADALLVVGATNETETYTNKWGFTYFAILPALFVPATEQNVLFLSHATLWDVRNQLLYLSAEGEGENHQTRPVAFTDERKAVNEAKEESLNYLRDAIARMAGGLVQTAAK
jgi:hypothetical protein